MDRLKHLLLNEELKQLEELESKLKKLYFESHDTESIIAKITPLFDDVLLERLQNRDDQTIKILSEHLARIITKSVQSNNAELSLSLQQVIGPAISKEIASNRDTMVDTFYPIMGGMISKYVSHAIKEMTETINLKIENGLSFEKYKRKLKSKVTGVSETELLLEESNNALISSLFVIEKESGMLIVEAHFEDKAISDPHMVASMASAIKDFINDWIQDNEKKNEIQILSYGSATLYIESAGSVYIIAFLDAEPNHELRSSINAFFASIVQQYAMFFQNFDGDDSAEEIGELGDKMRGYLNTQHIARHSPAKRSTRNPSKYLLIIFAVSVLTYLGYAAKEAYLEYQLEKKIEKDTGYKIEVEREEGFMRLSGNVEHFVDANTILKIAKNATNQPIMNHLQMPISDMEQELILQQDRLTRLVDEKVEGLFRENMDREKELESNIRENVKNIESLIVHLDEQEIKVERLKQQKIAIGNIIKLKEKIRKKLLTAFASNTVFNLKEQSIDFAEGDLFGVGNSKINEKSKIVVKNNFELYITQLLEDKEIRRYIKTIVIEGHTDSSGSPMLNTILSKERAELLKKYLLTLEIVKKFKCESLFVSKGYANTQAIFKNGKEDKKASRRVTIKFIVDENRMLQEIGKIVK
ncbi:MAG: OmpA family protein [Campylobacterota bacterium]|nr:OmpA family protein [Campylobacterota bacterium]